VIDLLIDRGYQIQRVKLGGHWGRCQPHIAGCHASQRNHATEKVK